METVSSPLPPVNFAEVLQRLVASLELLRQWAPGAREAGIYELSIRVEPELGLGITARADVAEEAAARLAELPHAQGFEWVAGAALGSLHGFPVGLYGRSIGGGQ